MPAVSIIAPVYNTEKYLSRCIDSILAQTYVDFELILVDDGSPDNCGNICDEYAKIDSRIKVIHQSNGGVSTARNAALSIATGSKVTFCDSDDYLLSDYLYDLIQAQRKSGADLIISGYERERDHNVVSKCVLECFTKDIHSYEEKAEYIERLSRWECWSSLFDMSIIRRHNIRFCTLCENFAEDYGFMLEYLLLCSSVCSIDACNYRYVIHSESMMANSVNIVKINQLNEISYQFGKRFFSVYPKEKKTFSFLHYKIINNQYAKIDMTNVSKEQMSLYRSTVNRIDWHDKWLRELSSHFIFLIKKYGFKNAIIKKIDINFCSGRWNLLHSLKKYYFGKIRRKRNGKNIGCRSRL